MIWKRTKRNRPVLPTTKKQRNKGDQKALGKIVLNCQHEQISIASVATL